MGEWIRVFIWLKFGKYLAAALGGLEVEGLEHVPVRGPVLLVPNHTSDVDPAVVGIPLPRLARYMAKSELFDIPILGPFIRFMGSFPVRRDSADRAAIRTAEAVLKNGEALVLFPEGRLSETGVMEPFQPGAAMLALRTGAPVVPVGIIGSTGILPYGDLIPHRARRPVKVRFGEPLNFEDLKALPRHDALAEATRRMEAAVARLAEQPIPMPQEKEEPENREIALAS